MAYLATIEAGTSQLLSFSPIAREATPGPDFTELEWSIIRLSRHDRLWTIRPFGPLRRFWNWLAGRGNPQLANARLELLRRIAVLSRHYGFTVPGDDVAEFLSAGFSADQYELLVSNMARARAAAHQPKGVPA